MLFALVYVFPLCLLRSFSCPLTFVLLFLFLSLPFFLQLSHVRPRVAGARLKGPEVSAAGIATHFVETSQLDALKEKLAGQS